MPELPDMPGELRDLLERNFARAENEELEPEWHDDRYGFDFDCPTCGAEHRCSFRYQPVQIPAELLAFLAGRLGGPARQATGPAG